MTVQHTLSTGDRLTNMCATQWQPMGWNPVLLTVDRRSHHSALNVFNSRYTFQLNSIYFCTETETDRFDSVNSGAVSGCEHTVCYRSTAHCHQITKISIHDKLQWLTHTRAPEHSQKHLIHKQHMHDLGHTEADIFMPGCTLISKISVTIVNSNNNSNNKNGSKC